MYIIILKHKKNYIKM